MISLGWEHENRKFSSPRAIRRRSPLPKLNITLEERIYERVSMVPFVGCWLWLLKLHENGYGQLKVGGIGRPAHVVSFECFRGPIPEGLELDHLCRVRCCVNPWHLEPVTHLENMRRGIKRTRTHCPHGHEYSSENTYFHDGRRRCRLCRIISSHEYWNRAKRLKQEAH